MDRLQKAKAGEKGGKCHTMVAWWWRDGWVVKLSQFPKRPKRNMSTQDALFTKQLFAFWLSWFHVYRRVKNDTIYENLNEMEFAPSNPVKAARRILVRTTPGLSLGIFSLESWHLYLDVSRVSLTYWVPQWIYDTSTLLLFSASINMTYLPPSPSKESQSPLPSK